MTRTTRYALLGAGGVLGLLLLAVAIEHLRGRLGLRAWQAEMRRQGERLTVEELRAPVPTGGATRPIAPSAAQNLWAVSGNPADHPRAMAYVAPGKARAVVRQTEWRSDSDRQVTWADFASAFAGPAQHRLPELRASLTNRQFAVTLDHSQGFTLLLPHLATAKTAAQALAVDALLALHEGDRARALQDFQAIAALLEQLDRDRLLISQLVRMAIAQVAWSTTWEALQTDGWTETELAALQAVWRQPQFLEPMATAYQMERAMAATDFARMRRSLTSLRELQGTAGVLPLPGLGQGAGGGGEDGWLASLARLGEPLRHTGYLLLWQVAWSRQDEWHYARLSQLSIVSARRAAQQRHWHAEGRGAPTDPATAGPLDWLEAAREPTGLYDRCRYLMSGVLYGTSVRASARAAMLETARELAVAAVALKRFQLRHGRFPTALAELQPEFVAEIPADYQSGQPLRYRLATDGTFTLYGVGDDARDDQANAEPTRDGARSVFLGRDWVWPRVATEEEARAVGPRRR